VKITGTWYNIRSKFNISRALKFYIHDCKKKCKKLKIENHAEVTTATIFY
jgi:hypothetical protein